MTDLVTIKRHPRHRSWGRGANEPARLAPEPAQAAGELVRVSRRSGRIGLDSSTPESLAGFLPPGASFGAAIAFG